MKYQFQNPISYDMDYELDLAEETREERYEREYWEFIENQAPPLEEEVILQGHDEPLTNYFNTLEWGDEVPF